MAAKVKSDTSFGDSVGVQGTPAFFVNGVSISGAQPFEAFKQVIDAEL
jgi:protein-disulfide isomerase